MIETTTDQTARLTRVTATPPEGFDVGVPEDYEALNDALGPWGGTASAIEIEERYDGTIVATYEND